MFLRLLTLLIVTLPLSGALASVKTSLVYHKIHDKSWFEHEQCLSCHQETTTVKYTLKPAICEECHASPNPGEVAEYITKKEPQSCLFCHVRSPNLNPTLHLVDSHSDCLDCHNDKHQKYRPKRQTCEGCHDNKTAHNVEAPVCYGCHIFSNYETLHAPSPTPSPTTPPKPTKR